MTTTQKVDTTGLSKEQMYVLPKALELATFLNVAYPELKSTRWHPCLFLSIAKDHYKASQETPA